MGIKILHGDCKEKLQSLCSNSINTCITSPPYWGLRDYGTATWEGGDEGCDHKEEKGFNKQNLAALADKFDPHKNPRNPNAYDTGKDVAIPNFKNQCGKCGAVRKDSQLGLEETPEDFVENLVEVFREVKRVLRDDGTLWLNLGDSYAMSSIRGGNKKFSGNVGAHNHYDKSIKKGKRNIPEGIKPKDLIGIPWRVAFALQADGWYLRQDIIWHKPNPMPESVTDRCTKAHEYIFLLSKSPKYYFDNEAIKEDAKQTIKSNRVGKKERVDYRPLGTIKDVVTGSDKTTVRTNKRNKRSVWTVTTKPFKGAHFATFPMDLIDPCVLAGCPIHGTVLDPFGGSGTTAEVANAHNRNAVLIELNEEYIEIAKERLAPGGDLFTEIEVVS